MKDYYMFFGQDGMPTAVFLTEEADESIDLFETLYRKSWVDLQAEGYFMLREKDVLPNVWDDIGERYRRQVQAAVVVKKPMEAPIIRLKGREAPKEVTIGLQTSMYLK